MDNMFIVEVGTLGNKNKCNNYIFLPILFQQGHFHTTGSNSGKVSESRQHKKPQNLKGSIFQDRFHLFCFFWENPMWLVSLPTPTWGACPRYGSCQGGCLLTIWEHGNRTRCRKGFRTQRVIFMKYLLVEQMRAWISVQKLSKNEQRDSEVMWMSSW